MKDRNDLIKAVYAGSFDPITSGHLDIIHRSLKFCDQLTIAIGINPSKNNMFTIEERIEQIKEATKHIGTNHINVISFQGLLVEYAKEERAQLLIRGIRSVSDFEYEINLANVNKILCPQIETIFLPTSPELAVVSSSMVKEIAKLGGAISSFVPIHVEKSILNKFGFIKHGQ